MTGRHASTGSDGAALGPAMLVGRTVAAQWSTAALLAVLTVVTTAFLLAVPRLASVASDRALGDAVRAASPQERDLGLRLTTRAGLASQASSRPTDGPAAPFDAVDAALRRAMGPHVLSLLGGSAVVAQSDPLLARRASGDALGVSQVQALVRVDSAALGRVRWTDGAAPGPATATRTLRDGTGQTHVVRVVPVALSATTARAWGVRVGDVLDLSAAGTAYRRTSPTSVVVSGLFEPLDPSDDVWTAEPRMLGIAKILTSQGGTADQAALVVPVSSYSAMGDGLWRGAGDRPPPSPSPAFDHTWRYELAPARLTADDVDDVRALLARLDTDPAVWAGVPNVPQVVTGLAGLLDRYDRDVAVTGVLTSFVTGGLTALAVLVLALTALLGAQRRDREVLLWRARGASQAQVLGLVGLSTSVFAAPLALGAGLAVATLVPGEASRTAWVEVALVVVLPPAVVVLATARRIRRLDAAAGESARLVRAARRVVLELAVVLLAVLAVTTVRARGVEIAAGRTDWYAAVTPVLVALAAAVVAVRLLPWPVSGLARVAARRRGVVAFMGLTRASRTGVGAAVPLAALVVGSALVSLVLTLTAVVGDHRELAAQRAVGADARVDAVRIDSRDVAALAARAGIEEALPAHIDPGATLSTADGVRSVVVVAVDPVRYAALVTGTPLAFTPRASGAVGDRLPVVLSSGSPQGDGVLRMRGLSAPVRHVATDAHLERAVNGHERVVALVPLDALTRVLPTTEPNAVFLGATPAAQRALDATAKHDRSSLGGLVTRVVTVEGVTAQVTGRALTRHVGLTFLIGVALTTVLSLLAVLLLLAATRPERWQLTMRLRTMGLRHGAEGRLAWAEVLPLLAAGLVAGCVVGVLVPPALAPALDLTPFTGAVSRLPLDARPLTGLLVGGVALALGAVALFLDAASTRRASLADHLRRGDSA